jgi:hypothetical protein
MISTSRRARLAISVSFLKYCVRQDSSSPVIMGWGLIACNTLALQAWWDGKRHHGTRRSKNQSYFFFRFGRLSLKGPLIPSATASRAKRSNSARSFFGGNANGLPRFHQYCASIFWFVFLPCDHYRMSTVRFGLLF